MYNDFHCQSVSQSVRNSTLIIIYFRLVHCNSLSLNRKIKKENKPFDSGRLLYYFFLFYDSLWLAIDWYIDTLFCCYFVDFFSVSSKWKFLLRTRSSICWRFICTYMCRHRKICVPLVTVVWQRSQNDKYDDLKIVWFFWEKIFFFKTARSTPWETNWENNSRLKSC